MIFGNCAYIQVVTLVINGLPTYTEVIENLYFTIVNR